MRGKIQIDVAENPVHFDFEGREVFLNGAKRERCDALGSLFPARMFGADLKRSGLERVLPPIAASR
jgi:hypothetical protein